MNPVYGYHNAMGQWVVPPQRTFDDVKIDAINRKIAYLEEEVRRLNNDMLRGKSRLKDLESLTGISPTRYEQPQTDLVNEEQDTIYLESAADLLESWVRKMSGMAYGNKIIHDLIEDTNEWLGAYE